MPPPRPLQSVRQPVQTRKEELSVFPVASSIVHPTSPASAASRIVSATISGASPNPLLQVRGHRQVRGIDDRAGMLQRFISRESAILSAKGGGRSGARCGKRLETKAGQNARRAGVPRIRNYKRPRAVVKCPETSCLFILGNTHNRCPAVGSRRWIPTTIIAAARTSAPSATRAQSVRGRHSTRSAMSTETGSRKILAEVTIAIRQRGTNLQ